MSSFTGDFASARSMDWEQFVSARSRSAIAHRVGLGRPDGMPRSDRVVRFGLPRIARGHRYVTLRIVANDERVLLFAADGTVAWLRRPPGRRAVGYFLVAVTLPPETDTLFLASFRRPGRMPTTRASSSERAWLSHLTWIGPRDAELDPEGGDARMQVSLLKSTLRTGYFLVEGASDPRDVLLPSVSLRVETAVAVADVAAPEPTLVSAFASAHMPAKVVSRAPFDVEVGFDGPDALAHEEWERVLIQGLNPDRLVTVKVLRVRNVDVADGCPDSVEFPVPAGAATQLATFTMVALAPGRVEVHLRFRQEGVTVGLLRLVGDASDGAPASPGRSDDRRPFQIRAPRDRVLEISVGASADGDTVGLEFDLMLDGEPHSWTRSVATDDVLSHLHEEVEKQWSKAVSAHPNSPRDRDAAFGAEVRGLGRTLFRDLLPKEMQKSMHADPERFRGLMIVTNEPRIPWEITCIAADDGPETLFAELGMVRGLSGVVSKSVIRIHPSRAKFLVPDYRDLLSALPSAAAEQDFLARNLHATPISPSSVTALKSILARRDYDLFHFVGHGTSSESDRDHQVILLMGPRGRSPVSFSSGDLEAALRRNEAKPDVGSGRVVVLNACHSGALWSETSGFAVAFLRGGADVFVGSQWSVADESAAYFASALYTGLQDGARVHEAVAKARDAAKENGDSGWVAYAVYADPDASVEFAPVDG